MKKFLALLVLASAPAVASGQAHADSIPRILERVDSGTTLRVRTGRQTIRGMFSGMSDDALVLATASGSQTPLRFSAVDEIWRQGSYWKQGAIAGAVTGTAVLASFGWVLLHVVCEQEDGCRNDYGTVVLYSVLLGGTGGGLVGAGLGYLSKRWVRLY